MRKHKSIIYVHVAVFFFPVGGRPARLDKSYSAPVLNVNWIQRVTYSSLQSPAVPILPLHRIMMLDWSEVAAQKLPPLSGQENECEEALLWET